MGSSSTPLETVYQGWSQPVPTAIIKGSNMIHYAVMFNILTIFESFFDLRQIYTLGHSQIIKDLS